MYHTHIWYIWSKENQASISAWDMPKKPRAPHWYPTAARRKEICQGQRHEFKSGFYHFKFCNVNQFTCFSFFLSLHPLFFLAIYTCKNISSTNNERTSQYRLNTATHCVSYTYLLWQALITSCKLQNAEPSPVDLLGKSCQSLYIDLAHKPYIKKDIPHSSVQQEQNDLSGFWWGGLFKDEA